MLRHLQVLSILFFQVNLFSFFSFTVQSCDSRHRPSECGRPPPCRVFETMTGKTINAFQKEKEKETSERAEVSQLCRAVGRTCFIFFSREEPCEDF